MCYSQEGERNAADKYYPLALFFDQKDKFGNFNGCFGASKPSLEEAQQEMDQQWQGGYTVAEDDYINPSSFAQALDGIEEEYEDEELRKQKEQDDKNYQDELVSSVTPESGYKNMFEQFMKHNIDQTQEEEEEKIDTTAKNEEKVCKLILIFRRRRKRPLNSCTINSSLMRVRSGTSQTTSKVSYMRRARLRLQIQLAHSSCSTRAATCSSTGP